MRILRFVAIALVALSGSNGMSGPATDLLPPFRVEANGKPIQVEGEASPCITDLDGDGAFDLLVGERGGCKMVIFRNTGSNEEPRFGAATLFKVGGVGASLPHVRDHT